MFWDYGGPSAPAAAAGKANGAHAAARAPPAAPQQQQQQPQQQQARANGAPAAPATVAKPQPQHRQAGAAAGGSGGAQQRREEQQRGGAPDQAEEPFSGTPMSPEFEVRPCRTDLGPQNSKITQRKPESKAKHPPLLDCAKRAAVGKASRAWAHNVCGSSREDPHSQDVLWPL